MSTSPDWLPDVAELISSVRKGTRANGYLPRTPPRSYNGFSLPSMPRIPQIPDESHVSESSPSRESQVRRLTPLRSSREHPLRSPEEGMNTRPATEDSHRKLVRRKCPEKTHSNAGRREAKSLGGPKDTDIVAAMAQRLSKVERALTQKNLEVEALRCELDVCRRSLARFHGSVETLSVVQENEDLRNQVNDMQQFLADYGLTWVGDNDEGVPPTTPKRHVGNDDDLSNSPRAVLWSAYSAYNERVEKYSRNAQSSRAIPHKAIDIKTLEARIEALNTIAEKESQIVQQNGVSRFDMDRRVTLTFYKDGLRVGDLPFFPYESAQGSRILQDIFDGYFPYCLKKQYPGGVPLCVKDSSSQPFTDFHDVHRAFVNRLPSKIIAADGEIFEIQSQIQKRMGDLSASPKVKETVDLRPDGCDKESQPCRIQVRNGTQSWIFQLNSLQTIQDLRSNIPIEGPFNLRGTFPPRLYDCPDQTLENAGLVPDATLFVHQLKS